MNIHTLQESEVQEAAALLLPMWVEHAKQAPELLDNSYIKNYDAVSYCRRAIKDPKQEIFVAEVNGKIVGIARVELQDAPGMYGGGQMAYFDDLVVHPDYRRQGIANKLIDSRIKYIKRKKIRICYSKIYSFNHPAQNLVKKHGFQDVYHHYYKFLN